MYIDKLINPHKPASRSGRTAWAWEQNAAQIIEAINAKHYLGYFASGEDITDEINDATSDVIVIPPGTYTVSGDITLTNKTLTGPGILNFTAGDLHIVNSSGTHGISGITVINATVDITESTNVFVTDCTIRDSNKTGIYIYKNCSNIHVTGNKIISVGITEVNGKGIAIAGYWDSATVPCTDIIVSKNIVIGSGILCIESWGYNKRVIISDNIIKGAGQAGSFGISVDKGDDHVVSGNVVEDIDSNGGQGIELAGAIRGLVHGNVIHGYDTGIDVLSAGGTVDSEDCCVFDNILYDSRDRGIRVFNGSNHVVKGNYFKDCLGATLNPQGTTNLIIKGNTGNSLQSAAGGVIFSDTSTVWMDGNHITSAGQYPVQSYGAGSILTLKNNYFGIGGTGNTIEQEVSGGIVRVMGHISATTPVGFYDSIETGITRSPARRFIRNFSSDPFTIRIKLQKTAGNQPASAFMVFWSSREDNTPRGGVFVVAFGNWTNYNGTPTLSQIGDTVTPALVAYDASSYPYWDFAMVTNDTENQAFVHMVGVSVTDIDEEYIISAV